MEYLKIRNWEKWQSYRADRGQPPWIKIHRRVMRNPEWVSLKDAERGQLVAIWLLAADHDGAIPASKAVIKRLCYLDNLPDLDKFVNLGFILPLDANVTSTRRQHDQPEAEAKAETDKIREEKIDTKKIIPKEMEKTWDEFKQHRIKLRKPMTPYAEQLIIKKLLKYQSEGLEVEEIINQTIEKGYQDVKWEAEKMLKHKKSKVILEGRPF